MNDVNSSPVDAELFRTALKLKVEPTWFIEQIIGATMFPRQREIMTDFYRGAYRELDLCAGMRSGKSVLMAMFAVIEFARLLLMPTPQKFFGLLKSQPIFIAVLSTSEDQALDSVFSNTRSMIEDCDFFKSFSLSIKDLSVAYRAENIEMKTLSSWSTTAIGRSNIAVFLDEIANFEKTAGRRGAWEIYSRLKKSTDTFKDDGHLFAISSPQHPSDIIMTLYKRDNPKALRLMFPTWEMNPNFTEEQLRAEHRFDLAAFYRDYACKPGLTFGQVFPEQLKFKSVPNVLLQDEPLVHVPRVLAIDPAVKNDAFGCATGYLDKSQDLFFVDGVLRFVRERGDPYISPSEVRTFIERRINSHQIYALVFDTWLYPELIESINNMGVQCVQHLVRKEDFDRVRELDACNRLNIVMDDVLKYETENLVIVSEKKVDHPSSGSKDVADCLANVVWFLATQYTPPAMPVVCVPF